MSWKHLGEVFDIHGGGVDLVFPHHENEIAQTRCAFNHEVMANYWMHNGFLQVEGEKMSKSLGNFVTIHELLTGWQGYRWPGSVIRFSMLQTHYRQPIDWTLARLEEASTRLAYFRQSTRGVPIGAPSPVVIDALADDLNTPEAIVELNRLYEFVKKNPLNVEKASELRASCAFLGLDIDEVDLKKMLIGLDEAFIQQNIHSRNAARAAKNWAESDRIRDELAALGIALKDNKDGTTSWEVKR